MRKIAMLLCFGLVLVFFSACSSSENSTEVSSAPQDIAAVLMEPLPAAGFKIAEIGGYDYYYDTHYLFKTFARVFPENPDVDMVREVVYLELCALEAVDAGMKLGPNDKDYLRYTYEHAVEKISQLEEGKAHWDEMPEENVEQLKNSLEINTAMVENFDCMITEITEDEGISKEEFFAGLADYEAKFFLAMEYKSMVTEELFEKGAIDVGEEAVEQNKIALNKKIDELFEKYDVKIVWE